MKRDILHVMLALIAGFILYAPSIPWAEIREAGTEWRESVIVYTEDGDPRSNLDTSQFSVVYKNGTGTRTKTETFYHLGNGIYDMNVDGPHELGYTRALVSYSGTYVATYWQDFEADRGFWSDFDTRMGNRSTTAYTYYTGVTTSISELNDISPAEVNSEVDTALSDYDPPTRAEATSDKNEILANTTAIVVDIAGLNDISTAEVNTEVDAALSDYDPPTRAEATADKVEILANTTAIAVDIAGLNDISPAEVNAEVDTALTDYDPPTRAEATSDKAAIIANDDTNYSNLTSAVLPILRNISSNVPAINPW